MYESLSSFARLKQLIDSGEAEGLHLECKSPGEPKLDQGLKNKLAMALSGFSNTAGGLIIWGMSTTRHKHSNLDVLSQIEPIGNCRRFAQQVETAVPTLTTPLITTCETKLVLKSKRDTRGVVLTHIPQTASDPIQSNLDHKFYSRHGDEFLPLPYDLLRRLFAATESPDLRPAIRVPLAEHHQDGSWEIPIIVENASSAVGEDVTVAVTVENPAACAALSANITFRDVSAINPGKTMYMASVPAMVHRGLDIIAGALNVRMASRKRTLRLTIGVFAKKMRARNWRVSLSLTRDTLSVTHLGESYLY